MIQSCLFILLHLAFRIQEKFAFVVCRSFLFGLLFDRYPTLSFHGERGGSVVECRTPEREVGGSKPNFRFKTSSIQIMNRKGNLQCYFASFDQV